MQRNNSLAINSDKDPLYCYQKLDAERRPDKEQVIQTLRTQRQKQRMESKYGLNDPVKEIEQILQNDAIIKYKEHLRELQKNIKGHRSGAGAIERSASEGKDENMEATFGGGGGTARKKEAAP